MRVIISGSRTVRDYNLIVRAVEESGFQIDVVVSGRAEGVDRYGEEWAANHDVPVDEYPADWGAHGRSAGHIRNREMADNADALIAIWDGESRGTRNMIETAKRLGLRVHVHRI
jgi:hypothetical protein